MKSDSVPNGQPRRKSLKVEGTDLQDEPTKSKKAEGELRKLSRVVEQSPRETSDELERRVQKRTSELVKANEQLRQKIEDFKQTENALREAELCYRTVANFTYDWEYWENTDGTLRYVSPSCERITGYKAEQFFTNPALLQEIISPEDKDIWDKHRHEAIERSKSGEVQFRIRRQDGQIRWIEHVCQPVLDSDGKFLGFRASNRDITERKKAEQALRRSEVLLRKKEQEYCHR